MNTWNFILIISISLSLTACGGGGNSSSSSEEIDTSTTTELSNNGSKLSINFKQISGQRWEADYVIANESSSTPIKGLRVTFPANSYDNIAIITTPSTWDAISANPDTVIGANGIYEIFTITSEIIDGDPLKGIRLEFDWLKSGSPSSQSFEIINL